MLRVSVLLLFLVLGINLCHADELYLDKEQVYQKKVMETGFKILNANNIEKRITFYYKPDSKFNIKDKITSKQIVLYKGCVPYFDNEDEMAALISREIAYMNDVRHGIFRRTAMGYNPRKYEIKADKRAVDYMVRAGYNPIGLILVINKTAGEPKIYESLTLKHKGSERMINVYEYIYQKYPYFLLNNEYLENNVYQNFLYATRQEREDIRMAQELRLKLKRINDAEKK